MSLQVTAIWEARIRARKTWHLYLTLLLPFSVCHQTGSLGVRGSSGCYYSHRMPHLSRSATRSTKLTLLHWFEYRMTYYGDQLIACSHYTTVPICKVSTIGGTFRIPFPSFFLLITNNCFRQKKIYMYESDCYFRLGIKMAPNNLFMCETAVKLFLKEWNVFPDSKSVLSLYGDSISLLVRVAQKGQSNVSVEIFLHPSK